jgi:hypothetical protein
MSLEAVYQYFESYRKPESELFAVSCKGNEPSRDDVIEFERVVGFSLPEEFNQFTMSYLGGLYIEVKEELWPRPKLYDVGPFWSFMYAIKPGYFIRGFRVVLESPGRAAARIFGRSGRVFVGAGAIQTDSPQPPLAV